MATTARAGRRTRTGACATAVLAAAATTLLVLPVGPLHATHEAPSERGVEEACPPHQVPDSGFTDVAGNTHEAAIECVAAWDVAQGRTQTRYGPGAQTRRDQMAAFIARLLETAGVDVPWDAPRAFDDVPPGNVHFEAVNALARLGVVVGHDDGSFRPAAGVRRDQMASFISRSGEHALGEALVDDHPWFVDVDPADPHFEAVGGLAEAGIVQGSDAEARLYAPAADVRRDAMASFVGRTLDLLAAEGTIAPPPPEARAAVSTVRDVDGAELGEVFFTERSGGVEVQAFFEGLPPSGFHGFHLHGTGACEPDFAAAGGHHDPEDQPHAHHAGDMPVLMVGADGAARPRFVTDRVTVEGLLAGDGTAVIVHADPDNYANVPERYAADGPDEATLATGDAGARIGCGIVEASAGPAPVTAPPPPDAQATVRNADGAELGRVSFAQQTAAVEVWGTLEGLPPGGFHGFHLHGTGACEPDFTAAGGHHNPQGEPHAEHAGDMPVLMVADDGRAQFRFLTDRITADGLLAGDGTAVVVHAAPDNYANVPERYAPDGPDEATLATGDAGARIGCGVVQRAPR